MSLAGESSSDTRPVQRSTQRVPPHNLDAESSLLGAMLLSRDAVASALERGVLPDEFYKPIHRHIFDAIRSLNTGGEPVDAVTVAEELRRAGTLDTIGGLDALLTLQNATPAITSADRYAKIVRDTARLRRLIGAASDIAEIAFNEPDDVDKAIDDAESKIFDIGESHIGDNAEKVNVLIDQAIEKLQTLVDNKGAITGVPTGVAWLAAWHAQHHRSSSRHG
jgi:replicative DNA helicase